MSEISGTPYVAIGADGLGGTARVGDAIECDICGEKHPLVGCEDAQGNPSEMLLTYRCGDGSYLAAVDGRYVMGRFRAYRQRGTRGAA